MSRAHLSERVAVGTAVDDVMWPHAAVLVQQLVDVGTTLPIVVFNVTALSAFSTSFLHSLGARVESLDPPMYIPKAFGSRLLPRPLLNSLRSPILSRYAPFAKLALWGQVQWSKIVLLDVDVVLMGNIDEMASFPRDTFSPEACNSIAPERCTPTSRHTTAGLNTGVMVVGPSRERFASMKSFTTSIAALIEAAHNRSEAAAIENVYLAYPEQSFLKRFWPAVMRSTIEGGARRDGYDWQWRTHQEPVYRCAPGSEAGCGRTNFMSRLYNARPIDCKTCSEDYVAKVKVVHYTCSFKPWAKPLAALSPCESNWTARWHRAKAIVCASAERHSAKHARREAGCV